MIRSRTTRSFRERLSALPADVRQKAKSNYKLFLADPYQPSLEFKRLEGRASTFSVRIGLHYRALGRMTANNEIVWYWIGSHSDYDKIV